MDRYIDKSEKIIPLSEETTERRQPDARMGPPPGRAGTPHGIPLQGTIIPCEDGDQVRRDTDSVSTYDPVHGHLTGIGDAVRETVNRCAVLIGGTWYEPSGSTVRTKIDIAIKEKVLPHIRLENGYRLGTAKAGDLMMNPDKLIHWLVKKREWNLKRKVDWKPPRKCPRGPNKPRKLTLRKRFILWLAHKLGVKL